MDKRVLAALAVMVFTVSSIGCSGSEFAAGTNANFTATTAEVRTLPDGSEIRTETVDGMTTETRTFKDPDGRIEKVVVTTKDGKRTARIYYRDKTVRDVPDNAVESALVETADKLEDIGEKAKDIGGEVADKAEDVGDKAADVGREAADKAEDVGDKTVSGAKKVGKTTAKGVKKAGSAIKDAVTP